MGEHALYGGQLIKIGTCEEMYYLRADQRHLISGYTFGPDDRFRFPFPDEDEIEPGQFHDHDRGVRIPEPFELPDGWSGHGTVQFISTAGYVLSIPCPEQYGQPGMSIDMPSVTVEREKPFGSDRTKTVTGPMRVGRNGFNGHPVVDQQVAVGAELWTIVRCNACGSKWRLNPEEAVSVINRFRAEALEKETGWSPAFLAAMADRIFAGYAHLDLPAKWREAS